MRGALKRTATVCWSAMSTRIINRTPAVRLNVPDNSFTWCIQKRYLQNQERWVYIFTLCRIYKNCQYADYTGVFLFRSFWWSYWHWDLLQLVSEEACSWSRNSTQIGFWEKIHIFLNSKWKEQNSSQTMDRMLEFILEDWTTVQNFQIFIDFWHN